MFDGAPRSPAVTPAQPVTVTPSLAPAPAAPPIDPKSIAILPFDNISEDKATNVFFADGVHEDILTNLGVVRELHVTSRTSVRQYRATTKPIRQIGAELGVAYVLEGSVRRTGNIVRVTGQLAFAQVLAWTGDKDGALAELARLLRTPFGENVYVARFNPARLPLRGDPRFEALLTDPKNNAPLF